MLMMMLMMKKKGAKSLAVAAILLATVGAIVPPTKEDLNDMSVRGEKFVDAQVENAVNGVKVMKEAMQKTEEGRQKLLEQLEETRQQKEEALRAAQEKEAELERQLDVCNETTRSLWEECKPCLRRSCVKFYSRTCSSGSGLVGRQLEEVLNRTSPFSIWINGEKISDLQREGRRQNQELRQLQDRYSVMADGVDSVFSDSMKVAQHVHSGPLSFRVPSFFTTFYRRRRSAPPFFQDPFHSFQNLFSPFMNQNFPGSLDSAPDAGEDGEVNEDVVVTRPFGDGRMTCREIRRNSAGCLRFKDECEKCRAIEHVDCDGKRPLEAPLRRELEEATAAAERFTRHYDDVLKELEEKMFATSSMLDLLNRQFGWVSSLANNTRDSLFTVQGVTCKDPDPEPDQPSTVEEPTQTDVSLQIFDSPMNISVPGNLPWTDPKFPEVVAQKALDRYKESSV
ncbi:clusterin [Neosynchiropus ocellatus]